MVIKYIYTIFLGLLLATFLAMVTATFYEAPKAPEYPEKLTMPFVRELPSSPQATTETPEQQQLRLDYEAKSKAYQEAMKIYNRNTSLIVLGGAIIMLVISLAWFHKLKEISDGILLGGVFSLLYSMIRGFESGDNKYQFLLVTIGLIIGFLLGYVKFVRPEHAKKD